MNRNILKLALASLLLHLSAHLRAADWLFRDGKSDYQIVISTDASPSEQTAARELQQYIRQMSGVQPAITTDLTTRGRSIFIGYNERVAALTGARKPRKDDESFTYKTVGHAVQDGTYRPTRRVHHTHAGSIGNLCTADIRRKFDEVWSMFH